MLAWITVLFLLSCGATLGHTVLRYRRILKGTGYFLKASIAYIVTGDEDAQLAALAASEGIQHKERLTRTEFLKSVAVSLADRKDWRLSAQIDRCQKLLRAVGQMEKQQRVLSLRDNLAIKNHLYYAALLTATNRCSRAGTPGSAAPAGRSRWAAHRTPCPRRPPHPNRCAPTFRRDWAGCSGPPPSLMRKPPTRRCSGSKSRLSPTHILPARTKTTVRAKRRMSRRPPPSCRAPPPRRTTRCRPAMIPVPRATRLVRNHPNWWRRRAPPRIGT